MRNRGVKGIALMGVAAVVCLCGSQPAPARAANIPYSLSITPFAGGYVFEGNQHITNQAVYGISAGYNLTEHWGLEATYTAVIDAKTTSANQTGGPAGVETAITVHGLRGDILYHFFPDEQLVPYIAVGGGALLISPRHRETNDDFLIDYGAGLKFFLTDRIALRADVRHIFDITYHDDIRPRDFYNNFAYTAGVTFQLGGVRPATPAVEAAKPVQEVQAPAPTPPPAPAPAPVPVVAPAGPAWLAKKEGAVAPADKIMITGINVEGNALEIFATERIRDYKVFTLSQPFQLVIDIGSAINGLGVKRIPVHKLGIATIRFGDYTDHFWVVLDAEQGGAIPYRIEEADHGLKVIMTQ